MVSFGTDTVSPVLRSQAAGNQIALTLRVTMKTVWKRSQSSSTSGHDLPLEGEAVPARLPLAYQSHFVTMIRRAANLHDGCCVPAAIQRNEPPLASCFHHISIMQMQPQPVTSLLLSSTYSRHTTSAAAPDGGFKNPYQLFFFPHITCVRLTLK